MRYPAVSELSSRLEVQYTSGLSPELFRGHDREVNVGRAVTQAEAPAEAAVGLDARATLQRELGCLVEVPAEVGTTEELLGQLSQGEGENTRGHGSGRPRAGEEVNVSLQGSVDGDGV